VESSHREDDRAEEPEPRCRIYQTRQGQEAKVHVKEHQRCIAFRGGGLPFDQDEVVDVAGATDSWRGQPAPETGVHPVAGSPDDGYWKFIKSRMKYPSLAFRPFS